MFKSTTEEMLMTWDFLRLEQEHVAGGRCAGTGICSEIIQNKVGGGERREAGMGRQVGLPSLRSAGIRSVA